MIRLLLIVILSLPVWGYCATQTINTMPTSNASFQTTLQAFLQKEDANRFAKKWAGFVFTGGIAGTSVSLAHEINAVIGFPGGYYVTQAASTHMYAASSRTFVYLDYDDVRTHTIAGATVTRSTRLVFVSMIAGSAEPTQPTGTCRLMRIDTDGTSITTVTDLRQAGEIDFEAYGLVFGSTLISATPTTCAMPPGVLVISKPVAMAASTTVPSGYGLKFLPGGYLTLAADQVLTVNGSIDAPVSYVFQGTGTFAGTPRVEELTAEWFGTDLGAIITKTAAMTSASFVISTSLTVSSVTTVAITRDLRFTNTGYVTVTDGAATTDLSINGGIAAGPTWIFRGAGTVGGSPFADYAYGEWFGATSGDDSDDDGVAITNTLNVFKRWDGLQRGVYLMKTSVVVPSQSEIDLHGGKLVGSDSLVEVFDGADYNNNKSGFVLDISGTMQGTTVAPCPGDDQEIDETALVAKNRINIQNGQIITNKAKGAVYVLAAYNVWMKNLLFTNSEITESGVITPLTGAANTSLVLIRNSFMVGINDSTFFGGTQGTAEDTDVVTGTKGLHVSATCKFIGYLVINNINLTNCILNKAEKNVYFDLNEFSDSGYTGMTGNAFVFRNCSLQDIGGKFGGYGFYFNGGAIWNARFEENKSERLHKVFYVSPNVSSHNFTIDGHWATNPGDLFDFNSTGGVVQVGGNIKVFCTKSLDLLPDQPTEYHLTNHNEADIVWYGPQWSVFDNSVVNLATNGSFNLDVTGWTGENGALTSVAGFRAQGCRVTYGSGSTQSATQDVTVSAGVTYTIFAKVLGGTPSGIHYKLDVWESGASIGDLEDDTSDNWKIVGPLTVVPSTTTLTVKLTRLSPDAGHIDWDDVQVYRDDEHQLGLFPGEAWDGGGNGSWVNQFEGKNDITSSKEYVKAFHDNFRFQNLVPSGTAPTITMTPLITGTNGMRLTILSGHGTDGTSQVTMAPYATDTAFCGIVVSTVVTDATAGSTVRFPTAASDTLNCTVELLADYAQKCWIVVRDTCRDWVIP